MRSQFFSALLIIFALFAPLPGEAQQAGKIWRVGILGGLSGPQSPRWEPFREGLREMGYVEGQNIAIEWRLSGGKAERFPDLAADLARLKVDVIVAVDNPATAAAQKVTRTIPIVMVLAMDPVGTGFVSTLARPGGNITGLSVQATELQGKALQLLKEAVPTVSRVAVVWDPTEPGRRVQAGEAEAAARALGLQPQLLQTRDPGELDRLFTGIAREKLDAVLVHPSQMIFAARTRITELATKSRLPAMGIIRWFPEAGGLMSYGAKDSDQFRRAATFVDKILKGARPADLPIEHPTRFELVINLKTARALGLTIPPSLLLRADQVIE